MDATLDMGKICRACLRSEGELFLIFDEKHADEQTSTNIATMLSELTKYKVERSDALPQLICIDCLKALRCAYRFKRECEQSYRRLVYVLKHEGDRNGLLTADGQELMNQLHAEKCTQTEDTSLYPCERCDEKYFTFDALRAHREHEHKGSAIVCRFCGKSFNRIGYLKTHIAVFHPESGYTSHNQCHLCKRQFTRREHMRRHLAVIHKIVETAEDDELAPTETQPEQEMVVVDRVVKLEMAAPEAQTVKTNVIETMEKTTTSTTTTTDALLQTEPIEDPIKQLGSDAEIKNFDIANRNVLAVTSDSDGDGEDEKPLSNLISRTPTEGFIEVLLSESPVEEQLMENVDDAANRIKCEPFAADVVQAGVPATVKRGRGRPPRGNKVAAATPVVDTSADTELTYKCTCCDIVFPQYTALRSHTCKAAFACEVCMTRFYKADDLSSHVCSIHNADEVGDSKCKASGKVLAPMMQYKRHMETKKYKCDVCEKSFTTKLYLQRHMATHGHKRYVCKECTQSYATKEELKTHIKAEGHDKPMLCPECGLRCKTSNILTVHMRRHNGEKPFKCKYCSKGFPRMDDLRVHEKYHTGEKSHFCETCGKGFQRKYNLTIHLRVHTGERPYKCPHCPQAFAQGNDLKAHIRRHTGERFRCEVCGAAFLQGYQIRQHKLTEHGIKEEPPTQRVAKFTSREEQEQQIKEILERELGKAMDTNVRTSAMLAPNGPEAIPATAAVTPITSNVMSAASGNLQDFISI